MTSETKNPDEPETMLSAAGAWHPKPNRLQPTQADRRGGLLCRAYPQPTSAGFGGGLTPPDTSTGIGRMEWMMMGRKRWMSLMLSLRRSTVY